jgi:hypothetical protein
MEIKDFGFWEWVNAIQYLISLAVTVVVIEALIREWRSR